MYARFAITGKHFNIYFQSKRFFYCAETCTCAFGRKREVTLRVLILLRVCQTQIYGPASGGRNTTIRQHNLIGLKAFFASIGKRPFSKTVNISYFLDILSVGEYGDTTLH